LLRNIHLAGCGYRGFPLQLLYSPGYVFLGAYYRQDHT
jgi:hypothetical protein